MSLTIEIQKKSRVDEIRKIERPSQVFDLEEVQEIKDAIQEHLLFIGVDGKNNIRNISLLGIGTSKNINIDSKSIIRTALLTACEGVILVHNHPSNSLVPSRLDKHFTNVTNKLLEVFHIKLLDHIIVTENNYLSMGETKAIQKAYKDKSIRTMNNALLIEENENLKEEIKNLNSKLEKHINKSRKIEEEEEFE